MANHALLTNIQDNAKKFPELAARVAQIRADARAELAPMDDPDPPWPGADAGAEEPQIDREADRMAQHRGDRPADMTDEEAAGLPPA